jgi:hypothetical protein
MGHLQKAKRFVRGGIGLLLAFIIIAAPLTAAAAPTVWLRGMVSNPRPEGLSGVNVYATAPGSSTPLYGPVPTTPWGEYQLNVDPGTYDIHFVPATDGWESGFNAATQPNVSVQTSGTLDKTLSYKTVSTPVGFDELRCGTSEDNPNAHLFTLFNYGSYGFAPNSMVTTTLNPGNVNMGSGTSTENGYTYGGYTQGFVGTETQLSPFTLAPGQYSYTFSAPGQASSAPVPFTVPNSCPTFSMEITPGVSGNNVSPNQTFPIAILSSSEFNAPARVDVSSLRFGASSEHLHGVAPQSCNTPADVNGDGRNDLVCNVVLASVWNPGQYNVLLTGRTTDEGSSLNGFLFVQHATVDVVDPDTVAPTASNLALTGMTTFTIFNIPLFSYFPANVTQTTITATGTDNPGGSGVTAAEYYFDNSAHVAMAVANNTATASNVSIAGLAAGNHTVNVRVRDAAGNWSAVISKTFTKF